ncbi:unnamed protein product [Schistocephalus solidus]|uniref:Transposase n=1 Tax=Schistocephalus solidus TaxID=70667 RepID=A0A183T8V9_SCHSO|nr:unnamed protein product [Schistocephalus solidus]
MAYWLRDQDKMVTPAYKRRRPRDEPTGRGNKLTSALGRCEVAQHQRPSSCTNIHAEAEAVNERKFDQSKAEKNRRPGCLSWKHWKQRFDETAIQRVRFDAQGRIATGPVFGVIKGPEMSFFR